MQQDRLQIILQKVTGVIGKPITSAAELSSTNNAVYLLETSEEKYTLKIINNKGTIADNTWMLYHVLDGTSRSHIKKLIHSDYLDDQEFFVFDYVEGDTLDGLLTADAPRTIDIDQVSSQLLAYVEDIHTIETTNFGHLKRSLIGGHQTFPAFLFDYQAPTIKTLFTNQATRHMAAWPLEISHLVLSNLSDFTPRLCPIDLNMKNLVLDSKGKLYIVDPAAVISSTPLATYGEICAHSFGMPLWESIKRKSATVHEYGTIIRAFAALSNMNTFAFILRNNPAVANVAKPWGNKNTFMDLIKVHYDEVRHEYGR